jgi:hypothetical protein
MDLLKKYNPWEIVVALLPPLFAIDEIWHYCTDDYPSALYQIVKHVFAFGYIAILLYSVYCMYRGAKWSGRFPKVMLTLLITLTAAELLAFANRFLPQGPTEDFGIPWYYYVLTGLTLAYTVVVLFAIVSMFMARINVLAIAFSCLVVVLPLLSSLAFSLFCTDFDDSTSTTLNIISHTNSILTSLCYSVIFLYRNDFYKPLDE